jgi:hypothetical protein
MKIKTIKIKTMKTKGQMTATIMAAMLGLTSPTLAQNLGISATGVAPHNSAMLDVDGDSGLSHGNKKGMLIPRISLSSVSDNTTIASPTISLVVYNTNASMTGGNGEGFYYWDGSKWVYILAPSNGPGTAGQVLTSQGSSNPPQWSTLSTGGGCIPTAITDELNASGIPVTSGNGALMNLLTCINHCHNLTYGGHSDWRVPTVEELLNLIPIAPQNTKWNYVWTVSPESNVNIGNYEYSVVSLGGTTIWWAPSGGTYYCRCVR